jgi:hypothetical protein
VADLEAKIGAIENVLRMAKAYDLDNIGAYQVRLTCQLSGDAQTWESPIYEGRLELPSSTLGVDWANMLIDVTLIWRRAAWWEQVVDIPVANDNHAATTAGLNIYPWNDKTGVSPNKKENYLDIVAGDVQGDLPAPVIIELVQAAGGANSPNDVAIYHNALAIPSTFPCELEGETGSGDTVDATRSGGKYHSYAIPAGTTGQDFGKDITATPILTGAWLRYLISAKFNGTITARPYISINSQKYYGPTSVLINSGGAYFNIYDLGMVRMPPITAIYGGPTGFYAIVWGMTILSATGITVSIDYLMATPIDSYAYIKGDSSLPYGANWVMNFHDGAAYGINTGNVVAVIGTVSGGINLLPNINQRLIFKMSSGRIDNFSSSDVYSVKVHAWLRKRTI